MNSRKAISSLVFIILLIPCLAVAETGGFSYEKSSLYTNIVGSEPDRAQLEDILTPQLEELFSLTSSSVSKFQLLVSLDEDNKAPTYNRKTKIFSCTLWVRLGFFQGETHLYHDNPSGHFRTLFRGDANSKEEALRNCLEKMATFILSSSATYFPTLGTIRDIDEGVLYLDRGRNQGIEAGQICDVFDGNGLKVGAIKITSTQSDQSTAKIMRGQNNIDVGNTFQTRYNTMNAGFTLEAFQVPVKSSFGAVYSQLVSTSGLDDISSAIGLRIGFEAPARWAMWSMGTGILKMGDKKPFFVDMLFSTPQVFLVFDRLSIFAKAGAGPVFHGGRPYARPDGEDYGDPLDNLGDTTMIFGYFVRAGVGLRYWFNPKTTLNIEAGYFTSGEATPSKEYGEGDNSEYYDIEPTFVEYSQLLMEGTMISVNLTFLVGIEK